MASVSGEVSAPTPPPTPDLHTLIAFAAKLFERSTTPNTPRWEKCITIDKTSLLDAIAAICAGGSQTVAAALTIDVRTCEVRLLISQSPSTDTSPLLKHVEETWDMLKSHGKYHRSGNTNNEIAERILLTRYMYKRFWPQLTKAVGDWWPALDAAHRGFGRWKRGCKLVGLEDRFQRAVVALRIAVPILKCDVQQLLAKTWCKLVWRMRIAARHVGELLKAWDKCQSWGIEFNDEDHRGFAPVRCALSEITNLQRHLNVLFNFTYYPRPSGIFDYTLRVSFPVSVPRSVHLPDSSTKWESVIKYLTADRRFVDPIWAATKAAELLETYKPTQMLVPHPGLALIAHLESVTNRRTHPPIGYIGVSRPLCSATLIWIRDYTKRGGRLYKYCGHRYSYQYFGWGYQGHWEWPWCAPDMETRDVSKKSKEVASSCISFMRDNRILRDECSYWYTDGEPISIGNHYPEMWARAMRKMKEQNTIQCVFGCRGTTRKCICFDVLEGVVAPTVEAEDSDYWH